MNGYTVNGVRNMVEIGKEALDALDSLAETRDDDYVVSEIRIYENMPIEAVLFDGVTFTTHVWDRSQWIPQRA